MSHNIPDPRKTELPGFLEGLDDAHRKREQDKINQYLTEKVLGEKWHEEVSRRVIGNTTTVFVLCSCGKEYTLPELYDLTMNKWGYWKKHLNPDFTQWQHYGPMVRKCMEEELWVDFTSHSRMWIFLTLFNPARGSHAIVEFLRQRDERLLLTANSANGRE